MCLSFDWLEAQSISDSAIVWRLQKLNAHGNMGSVTFSSVFVPGKYDF